MEIIGSIVTFNPNEQMLERTITTFLEGHQSRIVYIWDNSPTDKISARLLKLFPTQINYHLSPENSGYGSGHTANFFRSQEDFSFFCVLNPDLILQNGNLSKLTQFLEDHPQYGLITGSICDLEGNITPSNKTLPSFLTYLRFFLFKKFYKTSSSVFEIPALENRKIQSLPVLSGCFLLFTKSHFNELKGFDERFFLYFEDWDLSLRSFLARKSIILSDVKIHELL